MLYPKGIGSYAEGRASTRIDVPGEPPECGICRDAIDLGKAGKMVFIAASKPFEKDGKTYRRTTHMLSKNRQGKKEAMRSLGITSGKAYRRWLQEQRRNGALKAE